MPASGFEQRTFVRPQTQLRVAPQNFVLGKFFERNGVQLGAARGTGEDRALRTAHHQDAAAIEQPRLACTFEFDPQRVCPAQQRDIGRVFVVRHADDARLAGR